MICGIDKDGAIYIFTNVKFFAHKHNMDDSGIYKSLKYNRKYKQWSFYRLQDMDKAMFQVANTIIIEDESKPPMGISKQRLRGIFHKMHYRCNDPNHHAYKNYGAKGVRVCEEWHDFDNFYKWAMSNGYDDDLTIDRIDSNAGYNPSNCQWISKSENVARSNKSSPRNYNKNGSYYGIDSNGVLHIFSNANKFGAYYNMDARRIRVNAIHTNRRYFGWRFGFVKNLDKTTLKCVSTINLFE